MNSEKTRLVVEIIGIVSIVASLLFVGLQMRQTYEIALVTLTQMRSDASRELAVAQIGSEPLLAIDAKIEAGEDLTPYETMTQSLLPFIFFNHFENSHFLYTEGYLTGEQWQSDLVAIRYFTKAQPSYARYWADQKEIFRASFVEEIDRNLSE
jgi:hypothetical protein